MRFRHCPACAHCAIVPGSLRQYAGLGARAQIKRWAAEQPGWAVTSLYLTAASFAAAPTGASTITRFLTRPRAGVPSAGPPNGAPSASTSDGTPSAGPGQRLQQAASESLPGGASSEPAEQLQDEGCGSEQGAAQGITQAGARSGGGAHAQGGPAEVAAAGGGACERGGEDALPCSLAAWLGPARAHSSGAAAAAAAMERPNAAVEEGGSGALADGSADGSRLPAPERAGSSEHAAAPAEVSGPALQPGSGATSERAGASGATAQSSRGGEAGCSGRNACGGDALLIDFAEKVRWVLMPPGSSILTDCWKHYWQTAMTCRSSGLSYPHGQQACACNRMWTRRCWQRSRRTSGGSCSAHCSSVHSGKVKPSAAQGRRAPGSRPRRLLPSGRGRATAATHRSRTSTAGQSRLERPLLPYSSGCSTALYAIGS